MIDQPGLGVATMLGHGGILTPNVVKDFGLAEVTAVLGVERQREPEAIQPDLLRTPGEHAFRGRWERFHRLANDKRGFPISFIPSTLVHADEYLSGRYRLYQLEPRWRKTRDRSISVYKPANT